MATISPLYHGNSFKTTLSGRNIEKMTASIYEIEKLVELFQFPGNENQLEDEETNQPSVSTNEAKCDSNQTTADCTKKPKSPYAKIEPPKRREVLDPERDDPEALFFDEASANESQKNWKQTPKWDISYRQSVTASDVFLGMGFKNASTSSCENMVVTVELPGENRQNIDLKIERETINLTSPNFFLGLKLPHSVDPKRGNAQFDGEGEKLIITLIMDRELDLLNF